MPLARIEIEQVEAHRWVAEIEAGGRPHGPPFRRRTLSNREFSDMIEAVCAAYYEQVPDAKPAPALLATSEFDAPAALPEPELIAAVAQPAQRRTR